MRPILPLERSNPWKLCANARYPSDPNGATCPSKSASPTNVGGSQHRPLGIPSSTRFSGQQNSTSELCPAPQSGLLGARPTVPVAFYFSPKCCPCVLGHRSPLSCLRLPSLSRGLSLFDFHLASLLPLPYSFLCSARTTPPSLCLEYLLWIAWQKACQSASTSGGPHLSSAM